MFSFKYAKQLIPTKRNMVGVNVPAAICRAGLTAISSPANIKQISTNNARKPLQPDLTYSLLLWVRASKSVKMIASGYTLNLYCDNEKAHSWLNDPSAFSEFSSDEKNCKAICFRMAKKSGWKIKRDGTCLCPNCVKKK